MRKEYVRDFHRKYNKKIYGVIHIGAHECEESIAYEYADIKNVFWVEAQKDLYLKNKKKGFNIGHYCVSSTNNKEVIFNISNNSQSSSYLDLDIHKRDYPGINYIREEKMQTTTLKKIYEKENLKENFANYLHLDIQGAELEALKGAGDLLNNFDYIYTETNLLHMYKDCGLLWDLDDYLKKYNFIRLDTDFNPGDRKTISGEWPGIRDFVIDSWGDVLYVNKRLLTVDKIGERRN